MFRFSDLCGQLHGVYYLFLLFFHKISTGDRYRVCEFYGSLQFLHAHFWDIKEAIRVFKVSATP
jgi:hypothetical protein